MAGAWEIRAQRQVLVGILHTDVTTVAWSLGLRNLIVPGEIAPVAGMPFDMARNECVEAMLAGGFEWMFFLDSDVIPPHDTILRLMAHGQPFISGVYCRRSPPHAIPVMMKGGQWVTDLPPRGLIEVDVVGSGCLLPDTEVLTDVGPVRADELKLSHQLLTGTGLYRKVLASKARQYSGEVVGLSTYSYFNNVWLTPEHPVFVIPREWVHWCKPDSPLTGSLIEQFGRYVPAGEVKDGDYLATPIHRALRDRPSILLSDYLPASEDVTINGDEVFYRHGRSPVTGELVKYSNRVAVSDEFMEFCGFYLAEGSAGRQLEIHLGSHEHGLIDRVCGLARRCFGVDPTVRKVDGSTSLRIGGQVLGQFFRHNFGGSSDSKRIPHWMMQLPPRKQLSMLRGLVLGDGCCIEAGHARGGVWMNYATVSKVLARQVQMMFMRSGYVCNVRWSPPQNAKRAILTKYGYRYINGRFPVWYVNLYSKYAWWFTKDVLGREYDAPIAGWRKSFIVDGVLYSRAKPSTRKHYDGDVYDFQVDVDENYVAGNFLTHNCLLIHRQIFEKVPHQRPGHKWFDWRVNLKNHVPPGEAMSEDFTFCNHVRKFGVKVLVDCSIRCKHVGYAESDYGTFGPMETRPRT